MASSSGNLPDVGDHVWVWYTGKGANTIWFGISIKREFVSKNVDEVNEHNSTRKNEPLTDVQIRDQKYKKI